MQKLGRRSVASANVLKELPVILLKEHYPRGDFMRSIAKHRVCLFVDGTALPITYALSISARLQNLRNYEYYQRFAVLIISANLLPKLTACLSIHSAVFSKPVMLLFIPMKIKIGFSPFQECSIMCADVSVSFISIAQLLF